MEITLNIVIVGAGSVGQHVSEFLSKKKNNITLIDINRELLNKIAQNLDIATRYGSGTDWEILEELYDNQPDIIFALTDNDEVNLICCSIAKRLGYPKTVARIRKMDYLKKSSLDFGTIFSVDHFICPEQLVAQDIFNYALESGTIAVENFAHGAVQMRTMEVPQNWRKEKLKIYELNLPQDIVLGLIKRAIKQNPHTKQDYEIIFPHGNDHILPGDKISIIGQTEAVATIHNFFGIENKISTTAIIAGGSILALYTARILEANNIKTKIIEPDFDRCTYLAEELPKSIILHHAFDSYDFLCSEHIGSADIFVACSDDDELNILTGGLAKEVGCKNVIVPISNTDLSPLIEKLGLVYTVSPRISAVNKIFTIARSESVASMVSLYEDSAEIIEIKISSKSQIVGVPISDLAVNLPKDFLFGVIQNRGRILTATGNKILSPGDTVIVISNPKHIEGLQKIF